jgi:transposase-like protein
LTLPGLADTLLVIVGLSMKPTSKSPAPGDTSIGLSISKAKLPAAVIDVFVSKRRNIPAARTFFKTALLAHDKPLEVVTDLAQALETVIEEQIPKAFHNTEQYANNHVECDHGRLKSRLRLMRGLKTERTASVVIRGHAFIQNLRRGHYELGTDTTNQHLTITEAFDELVDLI